MNTYTIFLPLHLIFAIKNQIYIKQLFHKTNEYLLRLYGKGKFFYETRQKIFSLLGGKIKFELALQPSTASTAKIQIQFSRQRD